MIARLFLLGARRPLPVALLVAIVTAFLGAGMARLELDTSFDSLIPSDDPDRLVYQRVMGEFGSDNKTIVYVRDEDLWSPAKLARLDGLRT